MLVHTMATASTPSWPTARAISAMRGLAYLGEGEVSVSRVPFRRAFESRGSPVRDDLLLDIVG